jgi:tRNA1(Val) A37 N6-methylase TrmN6
VRLAGRERLGFYPLAVEEAKRIRRFLNFPSALCTALDPCIGDGVAFQAVTSDAQTRRYGIELDAYRAEQARSVVDEMIHANCFDVQCPVESFSLVYLNPPYDFEVGERKSQRMERLFLEHLYRWLRPGGVLVFVLPGPRIEECIATLSVQFRDVRVYRLTEPESQRYKQIVLFGVRRTRSERERLQDADITRARQWYGSLSRQPDRLSPLLVKPDQQYVIPTAEPVRLVYRGLPVDQIEDLLPKSSAYRQAAPVLFAQGADISGRPLTPLHGGHVGLLCTAGMLNGIFGEGETRHIAHWQSVKLVDKSEEEEDGKTVIREKERFSNELTLVFSTGEIAALK